MMDVQPRVRWMTQRLADVPRHNGWLAPGELEVLESKTIVKRRAEWRLGRWTAKQALRARYGKSTPVPDYNEIEIRAAADGAPEAFLRGRRASVGLSLSHSHGVALCTVADPHAGIGCDTEYIEKRSEALVADFFAAPERKEVRDTEPVRRPLIATLIWSAKESVLKAMREGLRRDPRDVVIQVPHENPQNEWVTFAARDAKTGETYNGWWRVSGTHVFTVVRPASLT